MAEVQGSEHFFPASGIFRGIRPHLRNLWLPGEVSLDLGIRRVI